VVAVSATDQATLTGDAVRNNPNRRANTGAAVILEGAHPDTDIRRVGRWIARARAEGVIQGVGDR